MGRIFQDIKYNHLIHINKAKLRYGTFNVVRYVSLKKKKKIHGYIDQLYV